MYRGKTFMAWVGARGGSKGLPNKNIRLMAGKPLIYWCIKAAQESGIFESIRVNSDSADILNTVDSFHFDKFWGQLRPTELAQDNSLIADAISNGLRRLFCKKTDYVFLIQPTSPLLRPSSIKNAADYIIDKDADMVVGVHPVKDPSIVIKPLPDDLSLKDWYPKEFRDKNRQELPTAYRINGYIYVAKWQLFAERRDWWLSQIYAFIMDKNEDIDIDDLRDFQLAEMVLKERLCYKEKTHLLKYIQSVMKGLWG